MTILLNFYDRLFSSSFVGLLLKSVAILVEVRRIESKIKQTPINDLLTPGSSYVFFVNYKNVDK